MTSHLLPGEAIHCSLFTVHCSLSVSIHPAALLHPWFKKLLFHYASRSDRTKRSYFLLLTIRVHHPAYAPPSVVTIKLLFPCSSRIRLNQEEFVLAACGLVVAICVSSPFKLLVLLPVPVFRLYLQEMNTLGAVKSMGCARFPAPLFENRIAPIEYLHGLWEIWKDLLRTWNGCCPYRVPTATATAFREAF